MFKARFASIYTKLDVDSRASAVVVAIERGILLQQGKAISRKRGGFGPGAIVLIPKCV